MPSAYIRGRNLVHILRSNAELVYQMLTKQFSGMPTCTTRKGSIFTGPRFIARSINRLTKL